MNLECHNLCRYTCERTMNTGYVNAVLCTVFLNLLSCCWASNVYAVNTMVMPPGIEYAESSATSVNTIFDDSLRGKPHHVDSQNMKLGDERIQPDGKYRDGEFLFLEKLKKFSEGRDLEGIWHYIYLVACLVVFVVVSFEIFIPMFRSITLAVVVPLSFFVFTCLIYLGEYLWALASVPPLAMLVYLVFRKVHRRDEHSSDRRSTD